jgi:hypothetical protein
MFGWFRAKEETIMPFPDNESAFVHACSLGYALLINARIPALVVEEGRRGIDGEHWYRIQLASQEGGLEIWGPTLSNAPALPKVGDLVAFRIVRFATELPDDANLVGYIDCRLEPVLNGRNGWRVADSFRPDNLKPELHLG